MVEILDIDIELDDFDATLHSKGQISKCHIECLAAGHKQYNAFTVLFTDPRGNMLRIWLYQNPSLNPVKHVAK